MPSFYRKKNLLEDNSIGKQLRQARLKQKIKIITAAENLNINKKYLSALEKNEFAKLPAGVYAKNFLREYAQFLNLDSQKLLDQFRKKNNPEKNEDREIFVKKIPQSQYSLILPKFIKNSLIIAIILICLGYLGYSLNNIIAPPKLIINNPSDNATLARNAVDIQGKTETEAKITINSELILTKKDGSFSKVIELKKGLNVITITAQKKYSRPNTIIKKIFVK